MDDTHRYLNDFCGKDNVVKFEQGQIQKLQIFKVKHVWELLLQARKNIGFEGLGGHLVDIGCGRGNLTRALAEHFETATGIDVSPEQISRAKEMFPDSNIEFLVGEGEKLPVASNSADAITAIFSIHHMNMDAFTSECLNILKPNGVAVFWTDNWIDIRSVDGSNPDATHLIQDMNRNLLEISQKQSHPVFYIIDGNKTRFNEITVTKNKSLLSAQNEVIVSLEQLRNLALSVPFYRNLAYPSPIDTFCKSLKAFWKMEEVPEKDVMLRGTREIFPIIIWK